MTAELPEHRRMQFRIGINLGDVIVEGDRIYGDGVNVGARVQPLADGAGWRSPGRCTTRSRASWR
jgi:adenylate cyclase